MERLCMRPGCDRSVVARLTYDTISCQVWLDQVRERPGPAQEICELHTSRLTVPRGWMLCDRRDESPALFVPERPAEVPAPVDAPTAGSALATPTAARPKLPASELQPDLFGLPVLAEESLLADESVPPAERPEPSIERRVERRVAQTAPVAPAAPLTPAVAPMPPEPVEPAAATAAPEQAPDVVPEDVPAAARNGQRNGARRRNGDGAVDADAAEQDDEDLPESLQATSPLLSRAFRATGHQRSVLTQTLLNDPD